MERIRPHMKKSKLSRRITWRVIAIISFFNVLIVAAIVVFVFIFSLGNGSMRGQYVTDGIAGNVETMLQLAKTVTFNNRTDIEANLDSPELLPCIPNLPIGVKPTFQYINQEADIKSGVNVFLYTDGLTEAKNADNQFFGQQRITDIVTAFEGSPQELIETMTAAVHQFVGDYEQSDDLTMLAFKIAIEQ